MQVYKHTPAQTRTTCPARCRAEPYRIFAISVPLHTPLKAPTQFSLVVVQSTLWQMTTARQKHFSCMVLQQALIHIHVCPDEMTWQGSLLFNKQ